MDRTTLLFKAWAWKREGLPDRDKFERPYKFDDSLVLKQSKLAIGCTVWDGSIVLARYLQHLEGGKAVDGKTVCELGSGAQALPGLVAATLGAKSVVVSDSGDALLELLKENVNRNIETGSIPSTTTVSDYFWGHDTSQAFGKNNKYDLVLVAECMYVEEAVDPLVSSLEQLCHADSTVYISYGRNRSCANRFHEAAEKAGFQVTEIPMSEWHPDFVDPCCTIIRLTPTNVDAAVKLLSKNIQSERTKQRKKSGSKSSLRKAKRQCTNQGDSNVRDKRQKLNK